MLFYKSFFRGFFVCLFVFVIFYLWCLKPAKRPNHLQIDVIKCSLRIYKTKKLTKGYHRTSPINSTERKRYAFHNQIYFYYLEPFAGFLWSAVQYGKKNLHVWFRYTVSIKKKYFLICHVHISRNSYTLSYSDEIETSMYFMISGYNRFLQTCRRGLEYSDSIHCRGVRQILQKEDVQSMTLNCIWWKQSSCEDWGVWSFWQYKRLEI